MPQIALDCFYIVPVLDSDNSVLMAQIMKTQLRTPHLFDDPLEATIDCPIGKNISFSVSEDKVGIFPKRSICLHQKLLLLLKVE